MFCHLCIFLLPLCFLSICAIPHLIFQRSISPPRSVLSRLPSDCFALFRTSHHPFSLISPPPQADGCRLCLRALFLCKWLTGEILHQWCHHCWSQEEKNYYFHSLSRVSSLYLLIQMILVYRSYFLKATKGKNRSFFRLASLISRWL